jgi:hypothetical protein
MNTQIVSEWLTCPPPLSVSSYSVDKW